MLPRKYNSLPFFFVVVELYIYIAVNNRTRTQFFIQSAPYFCPILPTVEYISTNFNKILQYKIPRKSVRREPTWYARADVTKLLCTVGGIIGLFLIYLHHVSAHLGRYQELLCIRSWNIRGLLMTVGEQCILTWKVQLKQYITRLK